VLRDVGHGADDSRAAYNRRVAPLSPTQLAWRGRVEAVLRIVEPALNLLLAAGDRISRVADRDGLDTPPPPRRVDAPGVPRRVTAGTPTRGSE